MKLKRFWRITNVHGDTFIVRNKNNWTDRPNTMIERIFVLSESV